MSKKVNCIIAFIMSVMLLILSAVPVCALISDKEEDLQQEDSAETTETENNITYDRIIVCTSKGLHTAYPENSIEAVNAAQSEFVSVSVKTTKDGTPVLMADETVERMCVDEEGKSVSGRVDSYSFDEIKEFYLKKGTGGTAEKTETKVPSLSELLNVVSGKIIVVDVNYNDLDAVLEVLNTEKNRQMTILRIDGNTQKIIDKLSSAGKVPNVILKYNGNIIFSVNSTIKKAAESGLNLVQLGTKNHHGVIFYKSVEKKIRKNGLTAVFSMTEPYNARREDNVTGWDNAVSHGFTVIETNYPELLGDYVSECGKTKDELNKLLEECSVYKDGNYPKDLKYEFNRAYKAAQEAVGKVSSQSQLGSALTSLSKASQALKQAENESTAASLFHFSAGRIITVVLCLAAVAAAQIYFYKRRQNEKQ
ncbi:MAG: glycerophosphodiester phosphodiesterase family protein [Clostridia bacterium]|nr:glycerophosphodiester phosphodiesterase family protein [Clostridia bacterium]